MYWEKVLGDLESEGFLKRIQDSFHVHVVMESTKVAHILDSVLTNNGNRIREIDGMRS